LLGDRPHLEFRSPHDVEPIGTVARKGERAVDGVTATGPTEYRRHQDALGSLEYDTSEGRPFADRASADKPAGPREFERAFGETSRIEELYAEFNDTGDDNGDDGGACARVLDGMNIGDGRHCWQINRDRERRQRAWLRKQVKSDPSWFLDAVKSDRANGPRATGMNDEFRAHEALDWIAKAETDPKFEAACSEVRAFYKSHLSIRGFCKKRGIWPNAFVHRRRKYFKAIADRLTREGVAKTPLSTKPTFGPGIVVGLDAIAKEFRCTVDKARAMVDDPNAPVAFHSEYAIALRKREPRPCQKFLPRGPSAIVRTYPVTRTPLQRNLLPWNDTSLAARPAIICASTNARSTAWSWSASCPPSRSAGPSASNYPTSRPSPVRLSPASAVSVNFDEGRHHGQP